MPDVARAVGVVAVTALVVVAFTVAGGLLEGGPGAGPGTPPDTVDHPEWDPASLLATQPDFTGTIDPDVDATGQRVVIDDAHANRLARAEYRPLIHALTRAGFEVQFLDDSEDIGEVLDGAEAFITVDPGRVFQPAAVEAVTEFTANGGTLVMAGEPTQATLVQGGLGPQVVTAYNNLGSLARNYGITYSMKYMYNLETYSGIYRNLYAEPAGEGPLTEGVDRLVVYTAAALDARAGQPLFETGPATYVKGTETTAPRSVVLRRGNVIAIGDTTLFSPTRYAAADNEVFIENLVEYLARN